MSTCELCNQTLTTNERGISLRLLGKDGKHLQCRQCLSRTLRVDPAVIDRKIEQYKKMGCPLFV